MKKINWCLAAQGAALDYQFTFGRAIFLAEQIVEGKWVPDVTDPESISEVQGLHRALDYHSDAWTHHKIPPPDCKLNGDQIHRLKVRFRSWMQGNGIGTVPAFVQEAMAA